MPESVVKEKLNMKDDFEVKAYKEKYGTNVSDWHRPNDVNEVVYNNDPNNNVTVFAIEVYNTWRKICRKN